MSKQNINNQDWSKAVSDILQNAEMSTSDELWNKINKSTNYPKKIGYHSVIKWTMTAAAVLILGFLSTAIWYNIMPTQSALVATNDSTYFDVDTVMIDLVPIDTVKTHPTIDNEYVSHETIVYNAHTPIKVNEDESDLDLNDPELLEQNQAEPYLVQEIEETDEKPEVKEDVQDKKTVEEPNLANSPKQETSFTQRSPYSTIMSKYKTLRKSSSTIVALNFGGSVPKSEYIATLNTKSTTPYALLSSIDAQNLFLDSYEKCDVDHKQPFSLSINVGYNTISNFSVGTGLSYTLLYSNVEKYNDESNLAQKIQFIGIPLWLSYDVFDRKHFSLYVGAGTRLEYCASAKVGSYDVSEQKWHSSVNTMLGAEYKINDFLGVYCEPDLSYYFTKTKLQSIRNDKPINFTLRFGVSFNL
ncbi:MAG: outer membrane beta-barrel protein [Rikenellaceae bacterium]